MNSITSDQLAEMEKHYRIGLINSLVGYRSLNLLGTTSQSGATNLCVISSAFHMGSNPPLFGMVMRPEREHNDTLRNIKEVGQYTLNNVLPQYYKQAHQTSASYPSGVSEFDECGFNPTYFADFKAPCVAEASIKVGLELREIIDVALNGTTIVIGEIVHIAVEEHLIGNDGFIDHSKAETLTVAGLDSYYQTEAIGRLAYAKPGTEIEVLKV
jgi:flavin reductase (DIM6/NTAB) family NADH-FMN oxidoreductase RutF